MSTETYAQLGRSRFPDVAQDLVAFRQKAHPRFPNLPRWRAVVSRSDMASQREVGKAQVPKRDSDGVKLQVVWEQIKTERARNAFAVRHSWPFTIHLANLDAAEEVSL